MAVALPGSYRTKLAEEEEVVHYDTEAERLEQEAAHREEIRKENLGLCFQIMFFLVYLLVFTVAMFLESSDSSSRFADHIRGAIQGGGPNHDQKMILDRIEKTDDVYSFLEQNFIPAFWANNTDTNQAEQYSEYLHPIDMYNRLIGSVRIRQVRVVAESDCQVDPMFVGYKISCFPMFNSGGPFSESNEDENTFGPEGKFKWAEDVAGTGYAGSMGTYPANGFMAYLSTNKTKATLVTRMLRDENFLGLQTRAVFIDFLVWNSNFGVYAVSRISIEFGPTGAVAAYLEMTMLSEQMLTVGGHGNTKDWCAFVFVVMIMMFVTYFMIEEGREIKKDKIAYFHDPWNVLDWINMLLLIWAFALRIAVFMNASDVDLGSKQIENPDIYSSVRSLASQAEQVKLLHSFNAVLLWNKCVKYLKHLPIVKVLVKTIWNAFRLFLPLMSMFIIGMIGFAMAYHIGFGDKVQELTTFPRTFIYLARAFLRDVQLMPVYYITPIFGAFLILLFYVMLVLVGVQVLFAIVTDAMYRSKHHPEGEDPEHKDEPLEEVLRELKKISFRMIKFCCPLIYRKFIKKPMTAEERQKMMEQHAQQGQQPDQLALKNLMDARDGTESSYSTGGSSEFREKTFTTAEIMLAIQHMSGRVLSEVQEVGIEIRSELHDVCERVAQMQMAVEELSWRAELVRREQDAVM